MASTPAAKSASWLPWPTAGRSTRRRVHCEGIGKLTPEDTEYAEDWGGVIKLIAKASRSQDGQTVSMLVAPMFVPEDSQLAGIDDVFNGILVDGDATGEVLFYGKGAGKLPTASAVITDVIDCAKPSSSDALFWENSTPEQCRQFVTDWQQTPSRFYLRLALQYRQQLTLIDELFASPVLLARKGAPDTEAAFVTGELTPMRLEALLEQLPKEKIEVLGRLFVL